MATNVFPVAVTSSSSVSAKAATIAGSGQYYKLSEKFVASVWTITCVNTTIARVVFFDAAGSSVGGAATSAGAISINLASDAAYALVTIDTGSNVVVTFTQTALPLISSSISFSGTLDTITSSGTYTPASGAGPAYVLCFGAGGGGGGSGNAASGGGGGGAGGLWAGFHTLPSSLSVTIGAFGNGGGPSGQEATAGNAGGTSVFGNIQATGGNGGGPGSGGTGGTTGIGSTTGGGSSINDLGTNIALASGGNGVTNAGTATPGIALVSPVQSVKSGSTGGGGAGSGAGSPSSGAGSGIGTGGNGVGSGGAGNAATGFAAGGGGGSGGASSGGRGSAGVIYVFRDLVI
jgi:hypothetical protein